MSKTDDGPLPQMSDALLGPDEVASLFRDYRACSTAIHIQVKAAPGLITPHTAPSLEEAEELIRSRPIRGLQIRYEFDGSRWCDTLMPVDGGVRLVRIKA